MFGLFKKKPVVIDQNTQKLINTLVVYDIKNGDTIITETDSHTLVFNVGRDVFSDRIKLSNIETVSKSSKRNVRIERHEIADIKHLDNRLNQIIEKYNDDRLKRYNDKRQKKINDFFESL